MGNADAKRRTRVLRLIRRYRALLIMSKSISGSQREALDKQLISARSASVNQLMKAEALCKAQFATVAERVGLIAEPDALVEACEKWPLPVLHIHYLSKIYIEQQWFSNFGEGRFTNWHLYPPHARIGIDPKAAQEDHDMRVEWRLLEASLFEDMAILWNEVISYDEEPAGSVPLLDERIPSKRFRALTRSTARAAFALLEGYLNGIALDSLMILNDLTPSERALLDESKGDDRQFSPVRLRDKLLKYPRIALRRRHPLFQETDFEAMAGVIQFERKHRDSLMHPTPKFEERRDQPREQVYYDITRDETRLIIDAVVRVIERIDDELDGLFGRVSIWLRKRSEDDQYPNSMFH